MMKQAEYTLDEFQARYRLSGEEAVRLFTKFGPGKINLDLLMRGKENHRMVRIGEGEAARQGRRSRMPGRTAAAGLGGVTAKS